MIVADNMECGRSIDDLNDLVALRVPLPCTTAGKLGDENGTVPVWHETRQGAVFLSLCCRRLRRPASLHVQLRKFCVQVSDRQHHPSPSLNPRHPHRKQGNRNWRSLLPVGSILGIINSVLAMQPNVGEKLIIEAAQTILLRFFVLPAPTAAEN